MPALPGTAKTVASISGKTGAEVEQEISVQRVAVYKAALVSKSGSGSMVLILGGTPVLRAPAFLSRTFSTTWLRADSLERFLEHFPSVTREQAVAAVGNCEGLVNFPCVSCSMNRCPRRSPHY